MLNNATSQQFSASPFHHILVGKSHEKNTFNLRFSLTLSFWDSPTKQPSIIDSCDKSEIKTLSILQFSVALSCWARYKRIDNDLIACCCRLKHQETMTFKSPSTALLFWLIHHHFAGVRVGQLRTTTTHPHCVSSLNFGAPVAQTSYFERTTTNNYPWKKTFRRKCNDFSRWV